MLMALRLLMLRRRPRGKAINKAEKTRMEARKVLGVWCEVCVCGRERERMYSVNTNVCV